MNFSILIRGDMAVIQTPEQVIEANKDELREIALGALDGGAKHFVVDFSRAEYIDSFGLATLVALSNRIHDRRGDLRLSHLSHDLRTLLRLTNLEVLFDGFDGGPSAA